MFHTPISNYTPAESRAMEDHFIRRAIDLKVKFRPTVFRLNGHTRKTAEAQKEMTERRDWMVRLIDHPMTTPEIQAATGLTKTQTQKTLESMRRDNRVGQIPGRAGKPATYFPLKTAAAGEGAQ